MSFLLLRPQSKCQSSVKAFSQANLPTVACGLIDTQLDQQAISQLPDKIAQLSTHFNDTIYIIVTSTVAAEQCVILKNKWPDYVTFFAVGASTGRIMQDAGLEVIIPKQARTEGLLALPALQYVTNKKIVVIKGFGGRELLVDSLDSRGANVQEWEVYARVKVSQPVSTQDWQAEQIRCIIATSGEVIQAAFDYFDHKWLQTRDWIVVSQRTATIAQQKGIRQIDISRDASDQALIQCAQQYLTSARHSSEL